MTTEAPKPKPRKPRRLQLPFDGRRPDAGQWAFDHRAGLCITLIAYLVIAIAFVFSKIAVGGRPHTQGMYIDLSQLEQLAEEKARLEEEVRRRQAEAQPDWSSLRNDISNEEGREQEREGRVSRDEAVNDAAGAASARMRANREAYERGLAEAEAIRNRRDDTEAPSATREASKKSGNVMVSYAFRDPVRHHTHLEIPGYRCERGGTVVVEVVVDRAGEVLSARLHERSGDEFMERVALEAARTSCFDINESAPARQSGLITYAFRPQ